MVAKPGGFKNVFEFLISFLSSLASVYGSDISSELLLQHCTKKPASVLLAMMVMNSNPLKV